jgi:hypothetical protein
MIRELQSSSFKEKENAESNDGFGYGVTGRAGYGCLRLSGRYCC